MASTQPSEIQSIIIFYGFKDWLAGSVQRTRRKAVRQTVSSDGPYLAAPGDPVFIKHRPKEVSRRKSIKVLTYFRRVYKVRVTIKRKDGKMATKKQTYNWKQTSSTSVLAIAAVVGISQLLGGSIRDAVAAAVLCALLLAYALGE